MPDNLKTKVVRATKWSAVTEIAAKLVNPIVSMILARLLTPEAFGVVATLTMIISFAEIFTDAGFQKYLVQHEFSDEKDKDESTNVAFWSNLVLSFVLWGIITLLREPLAAAVGNPGLGNVLVIACVSIPIAAFSSIQVALYKRDLDFKTLFKVRIVSVLIPLIVTIPLAFWLKSYWALVLGTIVQNAVNAILLTIMSKWKPRFYYSFRKLKVMFSFTVWSMIEAVSIWLTNYVDVFIVGKMLSQYYLGLYKTSSTLVGQIMGLVTSVTTPILFSALSRLQDDEQQFQRLFFRFQKIVGMLVIPMGVGIYLFSDLATEILLGDQWMEASGFVGLWGLTSAITIVLSHYSSEVYRAKGRPKLSVLAQWLHIIVLWPAILVSVKYGFETLYLVRSLVRLELVLVNVLIMYYWCRISPLKMLGNVMPSIIAAFAMMVVFMLIKSVAPDFNLFCCLALCSISYLLVLCMFDEEKKILFNFRNALRN